MTSESSLDFNESKKLNRFRANLRQQIQENTRLMKDLRIITEDNKALKDENIRLSKIIETLVDTTEGLERQLKFLESENEKIKEDFKRQVHSLEEEREREIKREQEEKKDEKKKKKEENTDGFTNIICALPSTLPSTLPSITTDEDLKTKGWFASWW